MEPLKPLSDDMVVSGRTTAILTDCLPAAYHNLMHEIMRRNGVPLDGSEEWIPEERAMNLYRELLTRAGPGVVFKAGQSIINIVPFPPEIDNVKAALHSLQQLYSMNHRGKDIGHYKVLEWMPNQREAIMECRNPYPESFDQGLLTGILRRFTQIIDRPPKVIVDTTKPMRSCGASSTTYWLYW